jgi:hypothetical protein
VIGVSKMTDDSLDKAWSLLRWTIEEAWGRYGLMLYGRVSRDGLAYHLEFYAQQARRLIVFKISYEFLEDAIDPYEMAKHQLGKMITRVVAERDTRE